MGRKLFKAQLDRKNGAVGVTKTQETVICHFVLPKEVQTKEQISVDIEDNSILVVTPLVVPILKALKEKLPPGNYKDAKKQAEFDSVTRMLSVKISGYTVPNQKIDVKDKQEM